MHCNTSVTRNADAPHPRFNNNATNALRRSNPSLNLPARLGDRVNRILEWNYMLDLRSRPVARKNSFVERTGLGARYGPVRRGVKGRRDGWIPGGKEKMKRQTRWWAGGGGMDEQRSTRARLISQSGWSGYDRLPWITHEQRIPASHRDIRV